MVQSKKELLIAALEQEEPSNTEEKDGLSKLTLENITLLKRLSRDQLIKVLDKMITGMSLLDSIVNIAPNAIKEINIGNIYHMEAQNINEKDINLNLNETNQQNIYHNYDECSPAWFYKISSFVPLRINLKERLLLRLLDATLNVSEYTDRIDTFSMSGKSRRVHHEIKQFCAILSGLSIANNYESGINLLKDRNYEDNAQFYSKVFEIGRRYKILNPDRMKDSYGKLIYLLMDSKRENIAEMLNFELVDKIYTIERFLSNVPNGEHFLSEPALEIATRDITCVGKSSNDIKREKRDKAAAINMLCTKYGNNDMNNTDNYIFGSRFGNYMPYSENNQSINNHMGPSFEEIEQAIYSLSDYRTHLRYNRDPCEKMIEYLKKYFNPNQIENGLSLSIEMGKSGSRLSHSHQKQYYYVMQSLTLWCEIAQDMFELWIAAENDMLDSDNPYDLLDTGQGLNRVQGCPRVGNLMNKILSRVQNRCNNWIGSSAIHLGDQNVPNALMFIDKYTQVSQILGPICLVIQNIPNIYNNNAGIKNYIKESFGNVEAAQKMILCDFFKYGFDGSGADNFFDAGSCIDGRLTSAWNWCSNISKKTYYSLFLLCGFSGFD